MLVVITDALLFVRQDFAMKYDPSSNLPTYSVDINIHITSKLHFLPTTKNKVLNQTVVL